MENQLKEAKHALVAAQAKVKSLFDKLASATTKLETLTKSNNSLKESHKTAREADVLVLYLTEGETIKKGDYLKSKELLIKSKDMIHRVKDEVQKLQNDLKQANLDEIAQQQKVDQLTVTQQETKAVVISMEDYRERLTRNRKQNLD